MSGIYTKNDFVYYESRGGATRIFLAKICNHSRWVVGKNVIWGFSLSRTSGYGHKILVRSEPVQDAMISELKEWQVWDMVEGWTQMSGTTIENGISIKSGLEEPKRAEGTQQRLPKRRLPVRKTSKITS